MGLAQLPFPLDRIIPKRLLLPLVLRELSRLVVVSSVRAQHRYEGMSLDQIARSRGQRLHDAVLDLLVEEDLAVAVIAEVMTENDVRAVLTHPRTMIGTDSFPQREGKPHPRSYGTYPRVLEHYVREDKLLTLETAIHKMTGMVAGKLGLADRGVIREGARADLVIFDPEHVHDRATYTDPRRHPDAITHVLVNGVPTVREGRHTGARPGRVLRRTQAPRAAARSDKE